MAEIVDDVSAMYQTPRHSGVDTGWKATGQPTVRKQRNKWVVRVDGIDTTTGKHRPRQLGTYSSQRSANAAARSARADERSTERGADPVSLTPGGYAA